MVKKTILLLLLLTCRHAFSWMDLHPNAENIVTSIQQLAFKEFPEAYNPSIIKNGQGFLMIFRYHPDREHRPFVSEIGIVQLDEALKPISSPYLLSTRPDGSKTPSQSEDARLFTYQERLFVIYNDNIDTPFFYGLRRDMFIAELIQHNDRYELAPPLKLHFEEGYRSQLMQKNWTPFEYEGKLFFCYSFNPQIILYCNLSTGECHKFFHTSFHSNWAHGTLRGSSQAELIDGEYFSFFHSGIYEHSEASSHYYLWHYFMGAYTFSASPPFKITSMIPSPIIVDRLYTRSNTAKRVILPGGFACAGDKIYLAYGKDDCEIWIMTLDKQALKKAMKPI